MSEQSPQNDNTAVSAAAELGAKLREAREKRGFSIGEVAERLKLPARQIEGLESGNYENMPELVFVRGFLRTYGRFLDLDENEVAAYLDRIMPQARNNVYAVQREEKSSSLSYQQTEVKNRFRNGFSACWLWRQSPAAFMPGRANLKRTMSGRRITMKLISAWAMWLRPI